MKQDYDGAIMQFKKQQEQQQISLQDKLIHSENELKLSKKSQVQFFVCLEFHLCPVSGLIVFYIYTNYLVFI